MSDVLARLQSALADRYTLERELGHGGMATVYLAEDLKHHRQVALKVLRPELAAALGPERFLREIEIAAQLHHPHVLPLYDSGEANGLLYYVMPYVEGESLRDRLEREKQLAIDDALHIAREVADALSYAHSHGVIHRDIKPENILLESGHAVVADFGIARAIDVAGGARLTETGLAIGTPAYMSPEQAGGEKELDGRSDLYSLGCVLHEMLAGQPPFTGPTVESLVHQHLSAEPPSVTAVRPSVPSWVAAALERSLAKTPADRFNPVALFGEAISPRMSTTGEPGASTSEAKPRPVWRRRGLLGAAAVIVLVAAVLIGRRTVPLSEPENPRTAIAVLPFQNQSTDEEYAFFAGGLHDELLIQLTKVAALKVISRTSVMGYSTQTRLISEIADELGVGTIVEGSVQVVGDRLRVSVQLIDAASDEHLWADRYDRTIDDAFAIQSDIAQRVVAAVGAALGSEEQQALTAAPTADPEAYRLYLQGLEYSKRPGYLRQNWEIAQEFLEQAITLDSTFAVALAELSTVHGKMSWFRFDPSARRVAWQRELAERALRLAPDLPQAHRAMGIALYMGQRDWQAALDELQIALRGLPNDADVLAWIGYTHRRLGNWDEALKALESVAELDRRNADVMSNLGGTLQFLRRYPEAIGAFHQALGLAPDVGIWRVRIADAYLRWTGELDSLRAVLDPLPTDVDLGAGRTSTAERARLLLLEREPDALLALLESTGLDTFESQTRFWPTALYAAWAHTMLGDTDAARAAFDLARIVVDSVMEDAPDDVRLHYARGLVTAGLGDTAQAVREARWLEQSEPYRLDAYNRPGLAAWRAEILAQVGGTEAALDEIERLLAGPSALSVHTLRLHPRWDPIRDDPRFRALLERYDPPQPVPLR
jgi:TolB-like protein/tetratricopeptide (TPR) repeat protein